MNRTTNLVRTKTTSRANHRGSVIRNSHRNSTKLSIDEGLSCADETRLIADYLNGSLAPAVQRFFEEHLSGCKDCTAFLKTYKKTLALTSSFLKREAPKPRLSFASLRATALGR